VNFDVEKNGDVAVVLLPEETLEASNVNDFKGKIEPILEENTKVVCDMSRVRFIDSMGCSLFLSLLKKLQRKGGGLRICCTTAPVENLFTLMGFDKLFGVFKTREEAVKAFK
jgi:anti-anti-sigma factor